MDLKEFENYVRNLADDEQIISLSIIDHLLVVEINTRINIFHSINTMITDKGIQPPRRFEKIINLVFSQLQKDRIITTDKREMSMFQLNLDEPPDNYDREKIQEIQNICRQKIDEVLSNLIPYFDQMDNENDTKNLYEFWKTVGENKSYLKDDLIWHDIQLHDFDIRYDKEFPELGEVNESTMNEFLEKFSKGILQSEQMDSTNTESTESKEEEIKNKCQALIGQVELQLRALIISMYGESRDWIKKENVPKDIIVGKFGKDGTIAKKAEESLERGGKILSEAPAFLNACTFGELVSIIMHKPKLFEDVFDDPKLQTTNVRFKDIEKIRNLAYHNDEQIRWDDDILAETKMLANKIITKIAAWIDGK